jgi:tripartite-type tricarboxylate transporter receptor subunit TctC
MSRRVFLLGAFLIGALQCVTPATAQDWPKKQPIKLVVPSAAGGGTDAIARTTAEFLSKRLGQTVVVENKPGASSTIGADAVSKSPPDGYTFLLTGAEFAIVPTVRKVPYSFDDFTYLVRAFNIPTVFVVGPKYGPKTIQEVLADMKARPGEVKYGSTGQGAIVHVAFAMFEDAAGVKLLHVPYQGIAPVFQALAAGTVDVTALTPPFPDNLRVVANTGTKRHPLFAQYPTLEEIGIKGASWDVWFGFMAPPNLPKPIADRLSAEITAVLNDPAAIAKYTEVVKHAPEAQPLIGDAFKQQVLKDNQMWKTVVDRHKITVE